MTAKLALFVPPQAVRTYGPSETGLSKKPLVPISFAGKIAQGGPPRMVGSDAYLRFIVIVTVAGLGAATFVIGRNSARFAFDLSVRARSSVAFTSADVSGMPLEKCNPLRSVNVQVSPSADVFQEVASPGESFPDA